MVLKPACQKVSTYPHGFSFASLLYPYATFLPVPVTPNVAARTAPRTKVKDFTGFKKTKPKKPADVKSSDSESDADKAVEAVGPKQDRCKRLLT